MITRGGPEAERLPVTISRTSHPSADKTNKGNCLSLLNQGDVIRRCGPRPGAPQHCRESLKTQGMEELKPSAGREQQASSTLPCFGGRRAEGRAAQHRCVRVTQPAWHHRAGAELGAVGAKPKDCEPTLSRAECGHPCTPRAHKWDGMSCAPSLSYLWVPAGLV